MRPAAQLSGTPSRGGRSRMATAPRSRLRSLHALAPTAQPAGQWVLGGPRGTDLQGSGSGVLCWGAASYLPSCAWASPRLHRREGRGDQGPRTFMGLGAAATAKARVAGMRRAHGGEPDRSLACLGGWRSVWTSMAGGRCTAGCMSLEWERQWARSVGLESCAVLPDRGDFKNLWLLVKQRSSACCPFHSR